MVSEGLLSSDKKFSATDDQTLLNQAAHAVQLQIELKIQQTKSVEWLRTTMHNFIKSQPGYNVTSETPSNDHLQGGALSYINSVLTPDANSNFRLMNRNPTQQDGTRHYNTDTSEGGYELLLANDVDNSNPVVQAEQLNWLYFLTHFGEIVKNDPSANFDSVRVDAVDNVDADLLNITAAYFRDVYGVDKNDLTANQHLSILEDWGHNDPLYVKDHGSDQLTMDDYMHTQLIWSLTKIQIIVVRCDDLWSIIWSTVLRTIRLIRQFLITALSVHTIVKFKRLSVILLRSCIRMLKIHWRHLWNNWRQPLRYTMRI